MNHEQWIKIVEDRLHWWAEWYSRGNLCGLGYPPCSLEYRMMCEGTIVRSTGPRQLAINQDAEEIESLICEMSQYHSIMAKVLRSYYFSQGGLREKSKKMNLSHSHYKHYVDLAHQWMIGRLSSDKKQKKILIK
jgi:hypothetical protein